MDERASSLERLDPLDDVEGDAGVDEVEVKREEIEQTRAEMSATIDAIKDRLSPQNLVQQAKESVHEATIGRAQQAASSVVEGAERVMSTAGDKARETSSTIVETIQHNPLPAALTGIGLAWLVMSARRQDSGRRFAERRYTNDDLRRFDYSPGYDEAASGRGAVGERLRDVQDKVAGVASQVQQKVGDAAGRVQETVGDVADRVQERAGDAAERARYQAWLAGASAREQAQRAAQGFERTLQQNPLALGAAMLAMGAAIGLMIPETRRENEMMGEARDRLVDRAQETAQEVKEKVQTVAQNVAQQAADTAREEARNQGLSS